MRTNLFTFCCTVLMFAVVLAQCGGGTTDPSPAALTATDAAIWGTIDALSTDNASIKATMTAEAKE